MKDLILKFSKSIKTGVLAMLFSLLFGAILIVLSGANPIEAYSALIRGSLGSPQVLSQTIAKAIPLIFSGLAVAIAHQCKALNIGGEGQLVVGAFFAALVGNNIDFLPGVLHIPTLLIVGFLAGSLWAFIPALLKIKKNVNTVISTIMMNYVGISLVSFLISSYFRADNSDFVTMESLPKSSILNFIRIGNFRFTIGIILAIIIAFILKFILDKTVLGYEIKAVGSNPIATNVNGIDSSKNTLIALLVSGGLAGLVGVFDLVTNLNGKLFDGYNPGYGFDGIPIALLAKGNPVGVIFTALLFSVLRTGAITMQTSSGVSSTVIDAMQGVIIIFIASEYIFSLLKKKKKEVA